MAVDKLVDSAQLDADLTSVANAIRTKGGTSASLAFPAGFVQAIEDIPTGGGGDDREDLTTPKDVDFIDFDGRLLYSYTASEFGDLSALPENPSYLGLTAQGWNWTLSDAKAFVAEYGALVIGQNYTTNDGKTRIYISLSDSFVQSGASFPIVLNASSASFEIDWGDETSPDTATNKSNTVAYTHIYSTPGDYIIKISVTSGSLRLGHWGTNRTLLETNPRAQACLRKVEVGSGVVGFCRNAFAIMPNLESISIPTTCNSHDTGSDQGIFGSFLLRGIVFPSGTPGTSAQITNGRQNGLPELRYISIPKSMTGFKWNAPYAFSLRKMIFYNYNQSTNLDLYLYDAPSLTHFIVPGSYTNAGVDRVRQSYIRKLWIPASVTTIGAYAFAYNVFLEEIHVLPTSPPTLSNKNAFNSLPGTCVIYVPYSEDHSILNAYKTATNWSTYAAQMQEEPQ